MSSPDIAGLIEALRAGRLSLEEVAAQFRQRDWVPALRTAPASWAEMAEQQDVPPDVPGSFDEVTAAYDRGELTDDEYDVLCDAAADAFNAAARRDG